MTKFINFNERVEDSLQRLGREAEKILVQPEMRDFSKKEVLKESLKTLSSVEKFSRQNESQETSVKTAEDFLPKYLSQESGEAARTRINALIELALNDSIEGAIRKAKNDSPFIEDAFHDALVDKLLPLMEERGFLKK